jgi:hypothetical protein
MKECFGTNILYFPSILEQTLQPIYFGKRY